MARNYKRNFDKVFKDSPVKRTECDGLKRNIKFIKGDNFYHLLIIYIILLL